MNNLMEIHRDEYRKYLSPTEKLWLNVGWINEKNFYHQSLKKRIRSCIDYAEIVWDISEEKLKSKTRSREVVEARQMIMASLFLDSKDASSPFIAKEFNKNHSTVLYSAKVVNNLCETDKLFRIKYYYMLKNCSIVNEMKRIEDKFGSLIT